MSTAVSQAPAPVEHKTKPEKPDEAAYKVNLAQAEQALSVAQKKLVCTSYMRVIIGQSALYTCFGFLS